MTITTCIRHADWVVRWNVDKNRHEYVRQADVVFRGNAIEFVGRQFTGEADAEIDGCRLMVMPGLVNIHSHPTNQPITRAIREEIASPALYMTSLYDRTGLWKTSQAALYYGAIVAYGELLKCGVTSLVESSAVGAVSALAAAALRGRLSMEVLHVTTRKTLGISCMFFWIFSTTTSSALGLLD